MVDLRRSLRLCSWTRVRIVTRGMSELFASVLRVLTTRSYEYSVVEGREVAVVQANSGRGSVTQTCMADARTDQTMLLCYATLNERVPLARHEAIAELCGRLNSTMWTGNLELDRTRGEVRHRASIQFAGQGVSVAEVASLIDSNRYAINAYLSIILDVLDSDVALAATRDYQVYPATPPLAEPFSGFETNRQPPET
jgi:hypothetical protein